VWCIIAAESRESVACYKCFTMAQLAMNDSHQWAESAVIISTAP